MPRISKKVSPIVPLLFEYLREHGHLSETAEKKLLKATEKGWSEFAEQYGEPPKPRAKKPKDEQKKKAPKNKTAADEDEEVEEENADPSLDLEKALAGYKDAIDGVSHADEESYREQIRQLPEGELTNVLRQEYKGVSRADDLAYEEFDADMDDRDDSADAQEMLKRAQEEADAEQLDQLMDDFKEAAEQIGADTEEHPVVAPVIGIYSIAKRKALNA